MTTYLFTAAPLYRHLDWGGYLKTAVALSRQGHRVVWLAEAGPVAERVRAAGLAVSLVETVGFDWHLPDEPHTYEPEAWAAYRLRRNHLTWLPQERVAQATQSLLDLAAELRAEAIVSDPFLVPPALAAEALNLPYVVVGMPAVSAVEKTWFPAEAEVLEAWLADLDRLYARFGLNGRHLVQLNAGIWPHSPDLHLSFFSEAWYDRRGDVLLPQNRFVGGVKSEPQTEPPPWLDDLPAHLPSIYVTLGSTFNYEPEFFHLVARAVASMAAFPIIATYDAELSSGLRSLIPPQMALVLDEVDQAHLFPHLRGLIQHGGPGVTHAAILHALPQVVVAPGPGQGTQAHLVTRAGLGNFRHLTELTLENFRALIASTLTDQQIAANAKAWQARLAALPGIPGAVAHLEAVANA